MIVVDVNLLIYAHREQAPEHEAARSWLESVFDGPEAVGLPRSVLPAFVRISTDARALRPPMPPALALQTIETWFAAGNVSGPRALAFDHHAGENVPGPVPG